MQEYFQLHPFGLRSHSGSKTDSLESPRPENRNAVERRSSHTTPGVFRRNHGIYRWKKPGKKPKKGFKKKTGSPRSWQMAKTMIETHCDIPSYCPFHWKNSSFSTPSHKISTETPNILNPSQKISPKTPSFSRT